MNCTWISFPAFFCWIPNLWTFSALSIPLPSAASLSVFALESPAGSPVLARTANSLDWVSLRVRLFSYRAVSVFPVSNDPASHELDSWEFCSMCSLPISPSSRQSWSPWSLPDIHFCGFQSSYADWWDGSSPVYFLFLRASCWMQACWYYTEWVVCDSTFVWRAAQRTQPNCLQNSSTYRICKYVYISIYDVHLIWYLSNIHQYIRLASNMVFFQI